MPDAPASETESYRLPPIFKNFPDLWAAESKRHGGVSPAPYASLNLGINTDDDPANVVENRRLFFEMIGAPADQFAAARQIHGTEILHVTEPGYADGYDALITDQPGLLVGVTVADCVPILIYDHAHQVVAAIHAGWRGTVSGVVEKTLARMGEQFSTLGGQCYAYIGTCIDEPSYEVGTDVAEQFATKFKRTDSSTGKYYIDLKAANLQALTDFSIPAAQIGISPFSTVADNDDYFSHRAEKGQTGRMLVVIGLKSETK